MSENVRNFGTEISRLYLDIDGKIILKQRCVTRDWVCRQDSTCLGESTVAGFCAHGNEASVY